MVVNFAKLYLSPFFFLYLKLFFDSQQEPILFMSIFDKDIYRINGLQKVFRHISPHVKFVVLKSNTFYTKKSKQ
jgi:hypothetical protein